MRDASEKPHADAHMCFVPAATFRMGSDRHYPEEAPAHVVTVDGFWMDRHTVTNRDFRRFVEATGHVTLAERPVDPALYPGAQPELLAPSSVTSLLVSVGLAAIGFTVVALLHRMGQRAATLSARAAQQAGRR